MITISPSSYKGVEFFLIRNKSGAEIRLTNFGATVTSVKMPDKNGELTEIALGYEKIEPYLTNPNYFGSTVGRFANRIAGGRFTLNGTEYNLSVNEGENTLHGGAKGLSKRIFEAQPLGDEVIFTYKSEDGDQGFPGNLELKVSFVLTEENAVIISYDALSDKDTIISLTNHTYFNLNGCKRDILNNIVQINSNEITAVDDKLIPTGEFLQVSGTPYDLREPIALSAYVPDPLKCGYDVNYVVEKDDCASVYSPDTNIKMRVKTDLPGVQLYTAGALSDPTPGRNDSIYKPFYGLCLETQNFPDAIHRPEFPSCVLKAGETFHSATEYKFSVE